MGEVLPLPLARRERLRTLHRYGAAVGLDVVLLTDDERGLVAPLRLSLIGPTPAAVEHLGVYPHSDEGRAEADTCASMVLRALQVAESSTPPNEGAA